MISHVRCPVCDFHVTHKSGRISRHNAPGGVCKGSDADASDALREKIRDDLRIFNDSLDNCAATIAQAKSKERELRSWIRNANRMLQQINRRQQKESSK